ncbi:autophagy protein 13 [Naganishia albida]|nr:autophagy protein 13 [Naganishia albida]
MVDSSWQLSVLCYVDSISSFPRSDCLNRWHAKRHGPSFMDRPSSSTRTDGQQDDAARSKWSSTESLPFAIAPNAASGSYGSRPGIQGNRVSGSPIPGRRYSNLGSSAEPSSRASPNLGSGIGLGINSRSSSGNKSPGNSYERPSSLHRNSYLSQSGRSFTHITTAGGASPGYSGESRPRLQSLLSSPAMGATSGVSASPGTPPSLGYLGRASTSFSPSTSHSRPSSLGRGLPSNLHGAAAGSPTPPIPETHESGDDNEVPSPSIASSRNMRRYSSSFGQQTQQQRRTSTWLGHGSATSSGEPGSLVFGASSRGDGSAGESRRTSGSGFGMRRSSVTSLSRGHIKPTQAEADDLHEFLRLLETAPPPGNTLWDPVESEPSSQGRTGTKTTPDPPLGSSMSSTALRKPMTKSQVDEALRRMAGSYTPPFPPPSAGTSPRIPLMRPTVSPPVALERPIVTSPQAILQRHSSSVKSSSPLAGEPIRAHRIRSSLDTPASQTTTSQSGSTSASAASSVHEQVVEPLTFGKTRSSMRPEQPCEESDGARGESTDREKRRGTVLLRGGFGQFAQSSPTTREHSPLATTGGSMSPVSSNRLLQSPRRHTEREVPRFRPESDRTTRPPPPSDRTVAPILSAGAQPLDQGVRSWTRRPLGSDNGSETQPAVHVMYTAPSSLEGRRQRTSGWMAADEEYVPRPTFGEAGRHVRRTPLNTRRSDDGDDSIVGNLEMSGAQE